MPTGWLSETKPQPQPVADGATGHAADMQFVDHPRLAKRRTVEQDLDVHQVVRIGVEGPGEAGYQAEGGLKA